MSGANSNINIVFEIFSHNLQEKKKQYKMKMMRDNFCYLYLLDIRKVFSVVHIRHKKLLSEINSNTEKIWQYAKQYLRDND
jgi:predicted RNA-binding protein